MLALGDFVMDTETMKYGVQNTGRYDYDGIEAEAREEAWQLEAEIADFIKAPLSEADQASPATINQIFDELTVDAKPYRHQLKNGKRVNAFLLQADVIDQGYKMHIQASIYKGRGFGISSGKIVGYSLQAKVVPLGAIKGATFFQIVDYTDHANNTSGSSTGFRKHWRNNTLDASLVTRLTTYLCNAQGY
jgi:hypothetical protein